MTEAVNEPVPANAPWLLDWKKVATESGAITKEEEVPPVDYNKPKMPWLMDWKDVYKEPKIARPSLDYSSETSTSGFNMSAYTSKLTSTESGGNDKATNPKSSATGPHQFTKGTWEGTVAKMGADYSLEDRTDRVKSTKVLERFTQDNIKQATRDLGRAPTMTEAYMYHFIGASAPRLIQAPPDAPAKNYINADQYKANKPVFEGKTAGEVMNRFNRKFN